MIKIISFLALLFHPIFYSYAAKPLSIAIYDYPPVFIVNNGNNPGYCYEILHKLYSDLGYEVSKVEFNFPRAMRVVADQEVDIICAVNPFNGENLARSKVPLVTIKFYLWARQNSDFIYTDVASLAKKRIINITGFNYSPASVAYQSYIEQHPEAVSHLTGDKPLARAFQMIAMGRSDIIALDHDNALYNLQVNNLQAEIKQVGKLPNILNGYVGISQNHPDKDKLLALFDHEYPKLLASGFVSEIHQKYGMQNYSFVSSLKSNEQMPAPAGIPLH